VPRYMKPSKRNKSLAEPGGSAPIPGLRVVLLVWFNTSVLGTLFDTAALGSLGLRVVRNSSIGSLTHHIFRHGGVGSCACMLFDTLVVSTLRRHAVRHVGSGLAVPSCHPTRWRWARCPVSFHISQVGSLRLCVVRQVGVRPTSASAASHRHGLSQPSVEAVSLFRVTSFTAGWYFSSWGSPFGGKLASALGSPVVGRLHHLGVDCWHWARMRCRRVPATVLAYSGVSVMSGAGDKGRSYTTHEMGLLLSGSPLVIPSFHSTAVDGVHLAHIPLNKGRGTKGPCEPGCGVAQHPNTVDDGLKLRSHGTFVRELLLIPQSCP
jgi:hypothetical protein